MPKITNKQFKILLNSLAGDSAWEDFKVVYLEGYNDGYKDGMKR